MEDLCARCRQYVYYDLTRTDDSQSVGDDLVEIVTQHNDWDEESVLDRNHEGLGFLDDID